MKKPKESDLVRGVLEYFGMRGIMAWRNNTGALRSIYRRKDGTTKERFMRYGLLGSPDVYACLKPLGRLCGVECKQKGNKPTEAQQAFLAALNDSGGLGIVVYNLDELHNAIEAANIGQ